MIKFVIEIVIAFVIQTLDQINFTIASTLTSDCLLTVHIYMHRSHDSIDIDLSSFFVCVFGFQIIPLDLEGMQISKPLGQPLGQVSLGQPLGFS